MNRKLKMTIGILIVTIVIFIMLFVGASYSSSYFTAVYEIKQNKATSTDPSIKTFEATHIQAPNPIKAIYMTSWVAGRKDLRSNLVKLIDDTELNSVVIDVKDYSGRISFEVDNEDLKKIGSAEKRIPDIKEFIAGLHNKNIYVIGRISSFQDAFMVKARPDLAVRRESDNGVWQDHKGISWIDPGAKEYWNYLVKIGKESYHDGFDELNFDYIRFPSDGNMKDIKYPFTGTTTKAVMIKNFFEFIHDQLTPTGANLSADLFGMTTTNADDLNIGQVLENALPYFDYIDPMVYPSHYSPGFLNYKNPADFPYEVVKYSLDKAVERTLTASTTPYKIRPWLQDFDLGATYTAEMVRKQIQATYDAGLNSWMLWDAANTYTPGAVLENPQN